MSCILNIGLNNTGHLNTEQARKIAFTIIGGSNIREHKVVESANPGAVNSEPTYVVELFCDVPPGVIHRVAIALNQDCVAYYNQSDDFGLLIGPRAEEWGRFDASLFLLTDGNPLE